VGAEHKSSEDEDLELDGTFKYDWAAYQAKWGETPIQDTVTALFAEYTVLHARIRDKSGARCPPTMTLDVAESFDKQAATFVTDYLTPILEHIFSTKVHKLLRHILGAVRMHGNLRNGNTSGNETYHEADKVFYGRTYKRSDVFTEKVVRHAQGSRELLAARPLATADPHGGLQPTLSAQDSTAGAAARGGQPPAAVANMAATGAAVPDRPLPVPPARLTDSVVAPGRRVPPPAVAATATGPVASARVDHLTRVRVKELAKTPGLAAADKVLGLPGSASVPTLSFVRIAARFDCGSVRDQQLYAVPSYYGRSWFDALLYQVGESVVGGLCVTHWNSK